MLSVRHNMLAMNACRQFKNNNKIGARQTEKLSSGYKINRSADDAAGLAISEKMRRQIRGLTQASANAQDGISMVQSAEGALNEMHAILHRANELAVKASNGTWTDEDRALIDVEVQQLKKEIDTMAGHTVFNEIRLFPDDGLMPGAAFAMETYEFTLHYNLADGTYTVSDAGSGGTDGNVSGTAQNAGNTGGYVNNTAQAPAAGRAAVNPVPTSNALATMIATDLIPKAAEQIFNAFPSIKNDIGNVTVDIAIQVQKIDGLNKELARAGFTYRPTGKPYNLYIRVDSADFKVADADGTGSRVEALQSTIAHEFMHSLMQYTMTDGMSGRKGSAYKFPQWFSEGTAQLAGGGFPTQWNNTLISIANNLKDKDDTSQDGAIRNYLKRYTPAGRPYGHGYLAAAYAGYLANGGGAVTGPGIAAGMDKIFADLINGKTFNAAIKDNTGLTSAQLTGLFSNPSADLVNFVRELSFASKGGAGSVITPSLSVGGASIIGNGVWNPNPGQPGNPIVPPGFGSGERSTALQVGAEAGQHITIDLYRMDAWALGIDAVNVETVEAAQEAIGRIKKAINAVSQVRSDYGAVQNRLEHTISNLNNIIENTTAAESLIRDTDIAKEMVAFSNNRILLQAGQSILSQANQQQNYILSLLA